MSDLIASQLGNYRLIRLLGKGGFADVYLGEHVYLKTQAAIKVLHTLIADDNLQGFINEAQTIGRLHHPHIIRVLDFGVQNNTPFLVMDYAPRGTLRQLHPRGSHLPLSTIVSYVRQIADALQYAHNQKLIHRDIKPENMLLGSNNELLLSDFGIATMAQSSRYQMTQDVVGTVSYMAPEQIQGKPRPASDEYALGIVVYEWLTGSCPFQGSFTEVATQHILAPLPPIREKLPTISPNIEQVLLKALSKDPQQRFDTVYAFANAFAQACGGTPVPYANTGALATLASESEMETFVRPSLSGFDSTRISGGAPNGISTQGATPPSQKPPSPPPRYTRRMLLGGLGGLVVVGGGALAWVLVTQGSSQAALLKLTPTTPTHATPTATATPNPTSTPTPSPTATPIPTPRSNTPVPSQTVTTYLVYPGPSQMYTVSWSPGSGAWIASAGLGPNIEVWSATTKAPLFTYNGGSSIVYSVVWSPDGTRIASGHSDGTVKVWDISSQSEIFSEPGHTKNVNAVAWSPGGNFIVSAGGDKLVKVWEVGTGKLITTYSGHTSYVNAVAWSHDGSRIVSGGGDTIAQVWDAANAQPLYPSYTGHSSDILGLAWSLDDTRIASASKDSTAKVWHASNGTLYVNYTRHSSSINSLAWSPDGYYIATGSVDQTVKVWGPASGNTFVTYNDHSDQVQSVAWSPDSTKIASASNDGTVRVWQAAS